MTDPAADAAIAVAGLRREFAKRSGKRGVSAPVRALDGIDLAVPVGEVHGLLGPNGAGKTTLCKILSTVLLPSGGQARVCGLDVVKQAGAVRRRIGIVFGGDRGLYGRLSARDSLLFWAAMYEVPARAAPHRVTELLERVGLAGHGEARVETFSRGMKQRLHLARGLIADPAVLILDEPTLGMDPLAVREFRELVSELRAEGRTLLITTHDLAEAELMCDRVTMIDHGRVLATASPQELAGTLARFERVDVRDLDPQLAELIRGMPGVSTVDSAADGAITRIETDAEHAAAAVIGFLAQHKVSAIHASKPSLEEVYLALIGNRGLTV